MKRKSVKLDETDDTHDDKKKNVDKVSNNKPIKNDTNITTSNPDNEPFIEYILMDFRRFEDLDKFKNMKSLSLIQQGITSLEVIL